MLNSSNAYTRASQSIGYGVRSARRELPTVVDVDAGASSKGPQPCKKEDCCLVSY